MSAHSEGLTHRLVVSEQIGAVALDPIIGVQETERHPTDCLPRLPGLPATHVATTLGGMADITDQALFVGRFHIVLLHLPIGFLLLLAVLEIVARLPGLKSANASAGYILALTVPVSLATVACGWLLASGGEYDPELLFWHRWLGVAAAALSIVTAVLHRLAAGFAYRLCLFATVAVLMVASHYGGSITHGKDFLTRYAPASVRPLLGDTGAAEVPGGQSAGAAQRPAYATVVQPILDRTCVACHGADKAKGKLRLDSFEALLQGGAAGPVVEVGKTSAESELIKRILLPLEHDDHMPPEGKPQPTGDEVTLLRWWIDAGASGTQTATELKPSPEILRLIPAVTK